jgi:hypothetical protein
MAYLRRKVSSKKYAKKRTYKRKSSKKASGAMKKMVKREIARNVENKTFQVFDDLAEIYSSNSAGFDASIIPCTPFAGGYLTIAQGTGQGQRIGNRIKIKKLRFDAIVYPRQYNISTNPTPAPVHIKFWFFYDKEDGQSVPTPQASGDILQFGSTSLPFGNRLFDHMAPINTDRYRVLTTRTVKIGYSSYTGTGALPQQGNLANNDFKLNAKVSVDLTPYCVKDVVFRDTASTPTTRGIYMMAQAVYANGAAIAAASITAEMNTMLTIDFEDA